jgi:hypothetical protein
MFDFVPLDSEVTRAFAFDPPDVRRRARLVSAFGVMGLTGACALIVTHVTWMAVPLWFVLVPAAGGALSLGASLVVLRWKSLRLGSHLSAAAWFVVTGWGVFLRGGLMAHPLVMMGAAPFIATALLGRKGGLVWLVPVVLELVLLVGLHLGGVQLPDLMPLRHQLVSNVLVAVLFSALLVGMGLAQEWLRATAN